MPNGLLAIKLLEISGKDLEKYFVKHEPEEGILGLLPDELPQYFLNEKGLVTESDYIQWDAESDEKYVLIEAHSPDEILNEEVNNCGLNYIFEGIDMRDLLGEFKKHDYDSFHKLSSAEYLIIDTHYYSYWTDCGYEHDVTFNIVGKLKY